MTAIIVIGIIALLIFAFTMISIGADISFVDDNLSVSATVCGNSIQIFPRTHKKTPKPPKEEKPKPQKEKKPSDKPAKKGIPLDLNFDEIVGLLKKVLKGLAKFKNFTVEHFMLHVLVAGYDPYNIAVFFVKLNASLSVLGAFCAQNLKIKDADVYTDVDFIGGVPKLDFRIAVSIRIGQIFGVINTIIFGALGILIKNRVRVFKEKRSNKTDGNSTVNEEEIDSDTSNIQEEERNNENGTE